jgi:hypothetical protein
MAASGVEERSDRGSSVTLTVEVVAGESDITGRVPEGVGRAEPMRGGR